jgi:hypothetical protein
VFPASFLFHSILQAGLRTNCDYPELPVPLGCGEQLPAHTFRFLEPVRIRLTLPR